MPTSLEMSRNKATARDCPYKNAITTDEVADFNKREESSSISPDVGE